MEAKASFLEFVKGPTFPKLMVPQKLAKVRPLQNSGSLKIKEVGPLSLNIFPNYSTDISSININAGSPAPVFPSGIFA